MSFNVDIHRNLKNERFSHMTDLLCRQLIGLVFLFIFPLVLNCNEKNKHYYQNACYNFAQSVSQLTRYKAPLYQISGGTNTTVNCAGAKCTKIGKQLYV